MERRKFIGYVLTAAGGLCLTTEWAWAETFMSPEQARILLWGKEMNFEPLTVTLDDDQKKAIRKASGVRVLFDEIQAWKSPEGNWFLLDKVVGKHEFIDLAVAITAEGKIKGLEVLTYRETYGDEIRHPKWRAQFHGVNHEQKLKLDKQIRNISGATLSCVHVTEGINRLTQTWKLVLRELQ